MERGASTKGAWNRAHTAICARSSSSSVIGVPGGYLSRPHHVSHGCQSPEGPRQSPEPTGSRTARSSEGSAASRQPSGTAPGWSFLRSAAGEHLPGVLLPSHHLGDPRPAQGVEGGAAELARRHPTIPVDPDVVRRDHGAAVAADAARLSVMPLERVGGQAQFIVHEPPAADGASLAPLLDWMERNAHRELPLAALARRAGASTRTLSRRFREQTGTTPAQWLIAQRVRRARQLLETTSRSIERIADDVGFGSAVTLRERFRTAVGTSPQAYRRAFR
jgi:AraC-like DNA-binding protein